MSEQLNEWLQTLPEELQKDPVISNFKSPAELASAYREAKVAISRKGLILPPQGAKEEEWGPVYEQLGRPKDPKEYDISGVQIPKNMKLMEDEINEFRSMAHQLGMNKSQFQKAFGYRINKMVKEFEASEKSATETRQNSETALRQQFGAKYQEKVQGVQKMLDAYGGENAQAIVNKFGSDPDMISFMSRILDDMSEASIEKIGHNRGAELTPEEAKDEIHKIRTDKDHPLNMAFNTPGMGEKHLAAKKRIDQLYDQAYAGKKKI